MKKFGLPVTAICFLLLYHSSAAQGDKDLRQAKILKRQIQNNHYSPRPVDDSLSSSIFISFINGLDGEKEIFTNEDYKKLSAYQFLLDDELNGGSWNFLPFVSKLYKQRMLRADSMTKAILQKPIDFTADEQLVFENSTAYAADEKALAGKWTKWFKYIMLNHAYNIFFADSSKPSFSSVLEKKEKLIREKLKKVQAGSFASVVNTARYETEIKESYLDAVANAFDPHSNYLSPQQRENFQAHLSTEEYTFGFEIDEDNEGKIYIAMLIPGSPAWKSGEIHKNDELIQLQWKGEDLIDVLSVTIDEVDELLAKSNHNELFIKVKKQNGTFRTVTLRKEKTETEESVVKGFLLSGEKKVGYISLPDFYTTWEDENGSGCANDMAKEIVMMKKENLDGLILDLRYNGGGSLSEALQLCGIFIDDGPIAGIRQRDGRIVYGKDPNRGTIYDGPLLLLVNNQSASASELVAAALQDYNRAIIAGSPTYGKATMQEVMSMDTINKTKNDSPDGFLKITTGKIYRLNGLTAQYNGVTPDILLPDAFEGLEYREKFVPGAIRPDTVKKNSYYKPLSLLPVQALSAASNKRIENNPAFKYLQQAIKARISEPGSKKTEIPLKASLFEKWRKEKEALLNNMDERDDAENKFFKADSYRMEKERIQNNAYAKEMNEIALKNIQKDIYIQEAFLIMTDLIDLLKIK